MLLLLAAIVSCVVAQSTTGTTLTNATKDIRALTINQVPQGFSFTTPASQNFFLFTTDAQAKGNFLRRTDDANANGEPVQQLLSHADIAIGGGVGQFEVSPDDSYILFSASPARPSAAGRWQHYTVSVGGGSITRITPGFFPTGKTGAAVIGGFGSINNWQWISCQTSGQRSDLFWGVWETALRTTTSFANEIWVNDKSGNAKRISVALGQAQDVNSPLKVLDVLRADYDYVFYYANPGPDNSQSLATNPTETAGNAPRNIYMANWNGDNWQISPSPTAALSNATAPTLIRSTPGCTQKGPGRYVAGAERVTLFTQADIFVYDTTTKARVGTATVNPAGTGTCTLNRFTPDEAALIFSCLVTATTDNNQDVYLFKTLGTTAASKISAAYPATNLGFGPSQFELKGDYLIWRQVTAQTAAPVTNLGSVVVYNYKTFTGPTVLFTETATLKFADTTFHFADVESTSFTDVGAGNIGSTTATSTPYVWFKVRDTSPVAPAQPKNSYFRAAFNGAAGSAAQVEDTEDVTDLEARACAATTPFCGGINTDTCRLDGRSCLSRDCCKGQCSGYVTFLGRPLGKAQFQVYSAKHDGSSILKTDIAGTECTAGAPISPIIWKRVVGHPFTLPLQQYVYFTATTGVIGSEVQNLHRVQAGVAGTFTTPTFATPAPVARGGVWPNAGIAATKVCAATTQPSATTDVPGVSVGPAISPNGKWIIYQSQTVANGFVITAPALAPRAVAETFLAIGDSTTAPRKIGPAVSADLTSGGTFTPFWNADSSFAVWSYRDQSINAAGNQLTDDRHRDQLWSVEASIDAVPKTYNLTVISTSTLVNSARAAASFQFAPCNLKRVLYTTKLPEFSSPTQVYSVLVTGGNTVRVTHDPNVNAPVAAFTPLSTRDAIVWQSNYFSAGAQDVFINRAAASVVAPLVTLLAVVFALLQ